MLPSETAARQAEDMQSLPLALAFITLSAATASAASLSFNSGSLGAIADGTDATGVTFGPGAVAAGGDMAAVYPESGTVVTTVPWQSGLNPSASSPFTIEFWAFPTDGDNDDAPVSNRVATQTNRSGWVFFQRPAAEGWNFRAFDGVGSNVGWDLTGGTSPLNQWSHVVVTWTGSAAQLYVNGFLADDTNAGGRSGGYAPNTGTNLIIGASDTGSPYLGSVDEVAFYPTALSASQILANFNAASSSTPGAYHNQVIGAGARLLLSNNIPEPTSAALAACGLAGLLRRRR